MSIVSVFVTAILPVTVVAGVGAIIGGLTETDAGPLNTITLYVLLPSLIFHSLVTTSIPIGTAVKVGVGVGLYTLLMVLIAVVVTRVRGHGRASLSALVLGSTFTNAANYAIPVAAFAFGPVGRSAAVLFVIAQNVMMYTVGVYVASRSRAASRTAASEIFRLPLMYAVVVAVLAKWVDVVPTGTALETIRFTGEAAIPVMLLILGIELAGTRRAAVSAVRTPTVLKLLVAPVVGVAIALFLSFDTPVIARTFVLGCAAPTAIMPLVLAIKYSSTDADGSVDADTESEAISAPDSGGISVPIPQYVGAAVFLSTVASIPTLTILLWILQSGVII